MWSEYSETPARLTFISSSLECLFFFFLSLLGVTRIATASFCEKPFHTFLKVVAKNVSHRVSKAVPVRDESVIPPPTLVSADLLFSSDTSTPVCSCLWALCRTWPRDGTGACTDVCRVFTGKNGDNNRNLKCFDALKKTRGVICSEITEHSHDRHVSNFSFCTVRFVSGLSCWFLRILSAAQCVFVSSSSLSLEVFKSQIRVCWREAAGKGRESAVPFVLQHGC